MVRWLALPSSVCRRASTSTQEGIVRAVLDKFFWIGLLAHRGKQLLMPLAQGARDVFEEDQAEPNVLVLGGIHVAAQLDGREQDLGFGTRSAIASTVWSN